MAQTYFLFWYNPALEEDVTLHLNLFEPPLPKDTLRQIWLNRPSGSREENF